MAGEAASSSRVTGTFPTPGGSSPRAGRVPELQRAALDATQDVDHPAVLEPDLVVEEAPELFGELANRRLGALCGVQPVIVNVPQPGVALGDPGQLVHPVQHAGQLFLPGLGQQETVERLEGPPLVRAGYRLPAAEHVVQQLALAAMPAGDLLPELTVELAEVLLHLAEVGEQLPCGARELLVAVAHRGLVKHGQLTGLDPGDLPVDGLPLAAQLGQPFRGIGLGAEDDLPQQFDDDLQPRFGAHELALAQALQPLQRFLDRGCGIVVRLVGAVGVILAQPASPGSRPVVEVGPGRFGEPGSTPCTVLLVQRVQLVVQAAGQLGRGDGPYVVGHENPVQEAQHQWRVVRTKQPPRRAVVTQPRDLVHARHDPHRRAAHRHSPGSTAKHRIAPSVRQPHEP